MSSVVISGNTSGAVTLTVPDVAGTNTITLPASTGTVVTTGTPASGNVIQVVNATSTTGGAYISTTSTSFVATGLTVSITPKFSTSKIYICVTGVGQASSSNARFTVYRNSTNLGGTSGFVQSNASNFWVPLAMNYLDSPATTSATSYTVYFLNSGGSTTYWGGDGNTCSITVMEVAV